MASPCCGTVSVLFSFIMWTYPAIRPEVHALSRYYTEYKACYVYMASMVDGRCLELPGNYTLGEDRGGQLHYLVWSIEETHA
jgi:hypothetical protein